MRDRLVPFDRILNFRDFGGWETTDGARVARGALFRSASFHEASEGDLAKLDTMALRFLVDLRRPEERAHEPNRWSNEACRIICDEEEAGGPALPPHLIALMQSDLSPASTRNYMLGLYRDIPFDARLIGLYRNWFKELEEGGAGIIHCAAGKDRTGIACALTLIALGVDEEAVFADYEFTNQAVDLEKRMPRIQQRMLRPMLGVEIDYLRTALDAIDARYGSTLTYLERALGVSSAERNKLKDMLAT